MCLLFLQSYLVFRNYSAASDKMQLNNSTAAAGAAAAAAAAAAATTTLQLHGMDFYRVEILELGKGYRGGEGRGI